MTDKIQNMTKSGAFFRELYTRLTSASPSFFKVIQNISGFFIFLSGLALILKGFTDILPDWMDKALSVAIMSGAVSAYIVSKLPTVDRTQKLEEGELPFTTKKIEEGKDQ